MPTRCSPAIVLALSFAVGGLGLGAATQAQTAPGVERVIAHGIEITRAQVGPAALGARARPEHAGGEIRDNRAYPYVREMGHGAIYDGHRVDGPHRLIENVVLTSPVDVYATRPVVFRGVSIWTRAAAPWALHTRPGAGPVHFHWSEAGAADADGLVRDASRALDRALYLRSDNVTVHRSHLTRTADGIQIHAAGARVVETLIDALLTWPGQHNDGIQILGQGRDALILRNRIVNGNPQTSCLNISGRNIRILDNYLSGGGWTIYGGAQIKGYVAGSRQDVVVTGNLFGREHFAKGGNFGAVAYWDARAGGNVWRQNQFVTGETIPVSSPGTP